MAHHGSTPRSVLVAPELAVEVLSPQIGVTRRERRSGKLITAMGKQALLEALAAGHNVPFRKPAEPAPTRRKARAAANRARKKANPVRLRFPRPLPVDSEAPTADHYPGRGGW